MKIQQIQKMYGHGEMPAWHRPWLRYIDSVDGGGAQDAQEADEDTDTDADADEETDATEEDESTGEEFDAEKARAAIRKKNSENRNLRQRAADAEKKAKDAEGSTERVTALEAENLRLKVAVKHGLPESLASRLRGTTEEELLADAEELLDLFGGKKPPTDKPKEKLRSPGGKQPDGDVDINAMVKDIFTN